MSGAEGWQHELAVLRSELDGLDERLVDLLAQRFAVTARVGKLKAQFGLPARDQLRDEEKVARVRSLAAQRGLKSNSAEEIMRCIISEVVKEHEALRQ